MKSLYTAHPSLRLYMPDNEAATVNIETMTAIVLEFLKEKLHKSADVWLKYAAQFHVLLPNYRGQSHD